MALTGKHSPITILLGAKKWFYVEKESKSVLNSVEIIGEMTIHSRTRSDEPASLRIVRSRDVYQNAPRGQIGWNISLRLLQ